MRPRLFSLVQGAAALLCWLLALSCTADPHWLDHWNGDLGWGEIRAIVYVNGQFLAVGCPGTVMASPNGQHWTKLPSTGDDNWCQGMAYGQGIYVAVGHSIYGVWSGAIQTSYDGITWTGGKYAGDSGPQLSDVVFSSIFVAVGGDGKILTLGNPGESWVSRVSHTDEDLKGITHGENGFIAVGRYGTIRRSGDGVNWYTVNSTTSNNLYAVTFGDSTYVAVGANTVLTSPDGVSWTNRTPPEAYGINECVTHGNGLFVLGDNYGNIMTSPDGISWTDRTSSSSAHWRGITYGNPEGQDTFVIGGLLSAGYIATATEATGSLNVTLDPPYVSMDGGQWRFWDRTAGSGETLSGLLLGDYSFHFDSVPGWTTPDPQIIEIKYARTVSITGTYTHAYGHIWVRRTSGADVWLDGVAAGAGRFVAAGYSGTILTSEDAIEWTSRSSGTERNLFGITRSPDTFVVVGEQGTILTSADGLSWTSRSSGTAGWLEGIGYGEGMFVAVGESGQIRTSPNGTSWTGRTSPTTAGLVGVCHGDGTFVAVGLSGTIVRSENGVTWSSETSGTTDSIWDVTYGRGLFVAVGNSGLLLTSPTGETWTGGDSDTVQSLYDVAYLDGMFLALGVNGTILSSSNAVDWTQETSNTSRDLTDVTYLDGVLVASGEGGRILSAHVNARLRIRSIDIVGNDIVVTWQSPGGRTNTLEAADECISGGATLFDDLGPSKYIPHWGTIVLTNYLDADACSGARRIYRVRCD